MDKLPKVGDRIKVRELREGAPWYSSKVEDLLDDRISIDAPLKEGNIVAFPVGSKLQVHFERADALYSFVSVIVARRLVQGNLRLYDLELPKTVQRFQRRQMFRLDLVQEVKYKVLTLPYEDEAITLEEEKKGSIKDISGGGVRLVIKDELPKGSVLEITFPKDSLNMTLKGEIVNMYAKEGEELGLDKYAYGIKFLDLDRRTQDAIVSFIFAEQRRRRQRDLAVH
ncbi:MAG: PilZ domain-containing protein [Firmicutes bacterium]|nr:PilZ domain-containing protein [Bacillota bacterium]